MLPWVGITKTYIPPDIDATFTLDGVGVAVVAVATNEVDVDSPRVPVTAGGAVVSSRRFNTDSTLSLNAMITVCK